ncbi:unnamed protein product [Clonostachys rosea]|uniref:Uncharacterized protein n=1 Tax=Bionectria ochroleuca TaxID=29856 RepID=A0ABY6U1R6_BIOOC|nr:unnamed protein product [Clonostachys rosea]
MDTSPAQYSDTQDRDESDWNMMQDLSVTDEVDATNSATLMELAPAPLFSTLPNFNPLPDINTHDLEASWSSGSSTMVNEDLENGQGNADGELESASNSAASSGDGQWEAVTSEGPNAVPSADAMSSDDESWVDTNYSTSSTSSRHEQHRESEVDVARCKESHVASLFSPSQRNEHPIRRLCIGYEGHYTVCPHLRFSYADVQVWAAMGLGEGAGYTVECEEPLCPLYDAKIRYRRFEMYGDEVTVMWSAFPEACGTNQTRSSQSQFLSSCLTKLMSIYALFPGAFCAHVQRSFLEVVNLDTLKEVATPRAWGMRFSIHCPEPVCAASIACSLPRGGLNLLGHGPVTFFDRVTLLPGTVASDTNWISTLDPDSYRLV